MPDPRACAVCGQRIIWFEHGETILALDSTPDLEGQYVIVDGKAIFIDMIHEKAQAMLDSPKFQNHVLTCKPPKSMRPR